jgi:hypothetical protein
MTARSIFATLLVAGTLVLFGTGSGFAQVPAAPSTKGTDFWLAFPANFNATSSTAGLTLFISGDASTSGTVDIPGLESSFPFSVTAGQVTTIPIPGAAQLANGTADVDALESKGIHVTATLPVSVYGVSRILTSLSVDGYVGLPTNSLGTEYIALGYKNSSSTDTSGTFFAIVATANDTTVDIVPTVPTAGRTGRYSISLNRGQTYQLMNINTPSGDLSGTVITSTKPIAVFGGQRCANVPAVGFCDHLIEQLPPTTAWGNTFVTLPLATRLNGDTFRFIASDDGTTVRVNNEPVATLNRGEFYEQIIVAAAHISSDKPILVAQYSNSSSFSGSQGDPFMMLVPPTNRFLGSYTVATYDVATAGSPPVFGINYINLIAQEAASGSVQNNGVAVALTPIGNGFVGAQMPVDAEFPHSRLTGGGFPFAAFVYGFATNVSYGYPAGMLLTPDSDGDGILDPVDNCPFYPNPDQSTLPCAHSIAVLNTPTAAPCAPLWVQAKFKNESGQDIVTFKPDCVNTHFSIKDPAGNILPCRHRTRIYTIGKDTITIAKDAEFHVSCDLSEICPCSVLSAGVEGEQVLYAGDASFSGNAVDPDGTTELWQGAVNTAFTVAITGSPVETQTAAVSYNPNQWSLSGELEITATINLANTGLNASDIHPGSIRLNGTEPIIEGSASGTGSTLTVRFTGTGAVQSVGTPAPGTTVFPRVTGANSATTPTRFFAAQAPVSIPFNVAIDIKPRTFPNTINLGSSGTVPVAILSTATFYAGDVDPGTVELNGAEVKLRGKSNTPMASLEDVNGDGILDLVVHIVTSELEINPNDTIAVLRGYTKLPGRKAIYGLDTVRIVP